MKPTANRGGLSLSHPLAYEPRTKQLVNHGKNLRNT